jgi:signal transduction histidine kinase
LLLRARNLLAMRQSREASRDAERAKRQVVEAANRDLQEQGHELEMQSQQLQQQSAELEATNDELSVANEALMQANNELARARADADAANQAKLDFLKVMSHDLRTPLNAINGYVELLETGIRGPVTTAQTEDLRRIRRASAHLMGLIGNVLNFAKVDAAQLDYQIEPVAVDRLLVDAAAIIEPVARAKGIMFERAPASVSLTLISDRDKVMQILVNLLTNAIKFTAAGGRVRLACESAPGDRLVRFAVEDTGQGIAPDQLERIFEPFVQIRRKLYGTDEGAGLGLAISRNLARALGGDLTVISAPARGSTFTVILPSDRADVATK